MAFHNDRHSSLEQKEFLTRFMEQHTLFCRGQIMPLGAKGDEKYNSMWQFLAYNLNVIGPAIRPASSWKKVSLFFFFMIYRN